LDRFLDDAIEIDVDAICDGEAVVIGAIMQHIEQAGVHSGDSACSLPPYSLSEEILDSVRTQIKSIALEMGVVGLMNVQMAIQNNVIYLIEVNPRASRTVPFVSKCIGYSLAKVAARCMVGRSLEEQGITQEIIPQKVHVKEAVFPFNKFPGVDPILGPEMKSTGEVMGTGDTFGSAFAKAVLAAGDNLPRNGGRAFLSVKESDKTELQELGSKLVDLGFNLIATRGTQKVLEKCRLECEIINKVGEGRPDVSDMLKNEQIDLIINTTEGRKSIEDSAMIRRLALQQKVYYSTTIAGAQAACVALSEDKQRSVLKLQEIHQALGGVPSNA
jgi:carbamoyl-phosphate synthase large subunit